MSLLLSAALDVLALPPDPGTGTAPPQKVVTGVTTILGWGAWIVFAICVGGILIVAGSMAISAKRGHGGGEHAAGLTWVMGGCLLGASAAAIVGALI